MKLSAKDPDAILPTVIKAIDSVEDGITVIPKETVKTTAATEEKKESIIRLLISVDILLQCCAFVGTITSGPSVFLLKVRADDPCVTAIDCPQDMLPDCLTLNIDERAAISRRTKSFWAPTQKEMPHV